MLDLIKAALATPWKASNELRRISSAPWIRMAFLAHGLRWGQRWRIFGMPVLQLHRGSMLELGDGLELRSWPSSNPLMPNHRVVFATRSAEAVIRLGDDCGLTGATLVATQRIEIGNRVLVGANATIVDTDFHPLDAQLRRANINTGATAPVYIEDDVFIGMSAIILKGVRLGAGCVVGAGSVVTRDVAPSTVVAGNPAQVVPGVRGQGSTGSSPRRVADES
jgi:acetyltransferase-like isoleucine patch superfamily enzyme